MNSLSLAIGPRMLSPACVRPKSGRTAWNGLRAMNDLFCRNPNAEPCHSFVPRRLSALMTYDPARVYSAS